MSTQERLISAKISLLQLSQELGNISKACKKAGIARSSFYEIKKAYEQFGRDGLSPKPKRKPKMPNAFGEEMQAKVLDMTRRFPSYSYNRIARQLQLEGVSISGGGVRKVWDKQGLTRKLARYLWLEKETQEGRGTLTENAIKAIKRLKRLGEASDNHVQAENPGELVSQDLYMVGAIKGVGRIYLQTAVDCANSMGFARLCLSKLPIEAVVLVHEKLIPHYDALGVSVQAILTDCGREYCGKADQHPYEVYLGAQGIEHRTTRPASPYTNGFVERFHRTLKDEFFGKVFREKFYTNLVELQKDLDEFLVFYNTQRSHSGYKCLGRTPQQTMEAQLTGAGKELDTQAA